jgi:hypothetical protein
MGIHSCSSRIRRLTANVGLSAALLAVVAAPTQAGKDHTPPTFAGIKSATTCIPGPIRLNGKTSYDLAWEPATDNVTPSSEIVYKIYQATTSGGENFAKASYTTKPGVTSFNTPRLSEVKTFFFVVRARDRAGNEDSNTVEKEGQNLCV